MNRADIQYTVDDIEAHRPRRLPAKLLRFIISSCILSALFNKQHHHLRIGSGKGSMLLRKLCPRNSHHHAKDLWKRTAAWQQKRVIWSKKLSLSHAAAGNPLMFRTKSRILGAFRKPSVDLAGSDLPCRLLASLSPAIAGPIVNH